MGELSYELLSMGMRYWFVLLIALTLLRVFFLMRRDNREYRRALRQLPDAGLIGEVVDLQTGAAQPLPREGLIGSSRSCDIRHPGLHRREIEFVFRPGFGVKLIPIHRKHGGVLDQEPLKKGDDFALHGTVLEIRNVQLRFRLFAGLDLPLRQPPVMQPVEQPVQGPLPEPAYLEQGDSLPLASYPEPLPPSSSGPDLEMTWQFAPLPPEIVNPPEQEEPRLRSRRSRRTGGQAHD